MDVAHPAAKTLIELSRSQDEEVGDGSTSVVVLAGEILYLSIDLLEKQQLHPSRISLGFMRALEDALAILNDTARCIDSSKDEDLIHVINNSLNTKFSSKWKSILTKIAVEATKKVAVKTQTGRWDIDLK